MQFVVPKFIEREAKIVGPFTFRQFIFIGTAGGLTIFLYFFIKSFALFLVIAVILMGGSLILALKKVGGFMPLPTAIKNVFLFKTKPRVYLWHRKVIPPKVIKKTAALKEKPEEISPLKITAKSHLRELSSHLETRPKK